MTWTPVNVFEKSIGATQDTYSPRFVAYLARFLVNYDRCASVHACVCVLCPRPCESKKERLNVSQQPQDSILKSPCIYVCMYEIVSVGSVSTVTI